MTNVQSKFLNSVDVTCAAFHHSWTDSCVDNIAGLLLSALPYCLRVYATVYLVSLILRRRIPSREEIKNTIKGILQSSAFLTTNAFAFGIWTCAIRALLGRFYFLTVGLVPSFFASLTAILIERPVRRPMLALYVANLATETLWKMAEARGLVKSIANGQVLPMALAMSVLLYLYRLGLHKDKCKDSIFSILRLIVGKAEEGPLQPAQGEPTQQQSRARLNVWTITGLVTAYARLTDSLKRKHPSCPHSSNCAQYAVMGGLVPFAAGVGVQIALNLLLNMRKIIQLKFDWRKKLFNSDSLNLGLFVGGFPFLYRLMSCTLRHVCGRDDPLFALPAGLVASLAFFKYPNTTVALYALWKMLQLVYNYGEEKGIVPRVPGFITFLYSFCTALLFHASIMETLCVRPSYLIFLEAISGGRLSRFKVEGFDAFGLRSSAQAVAALQMVGITKTNTPAKFGMAFS